MKTNIAYKVCYVDHTGRYWSINNQRNRVEYFLEKEIFPKENKLFVFDTYAKALDHILPSSHITNIEKQYVIFKCATLNPIRYCCLTHKWVTPKWCPVGTMLCDSLTPIEIVFGGK